MHLGGGGCQHYCKGDVIVVLQLVFLCISEKFPVSQERKSQEISGRGFSVNAVKREVLLDSILSLAM